MAGAETSWQGIERPQCGQHRLLSFARIIAVVTVAVVAKCFSVLFSFVILFVFGGFFCCCFVFPCMSLWCTLFLARFCHSCGVKAAHSEFWIILAWSILSVDTTSLPPLSYSHCQRQVTLLTSDFAVWQEDIMVYYIATWWLQPLIGRVGGRKHLWNVPHVLARDGRTPHVTWQAWGCFLACTEMLVVSGFLWLPRRTLEWGRLVAPRWLWLPQGV